MSRFNPVSKELIQALIAVVGEKGVTTDPEKLEVYKTDEESNPIYHRIPEVAVFPESAEEVSKIMKLANQYLVPVTPRSAGTSLAGGAIPVYKGIVLVLERMNKILEFDAENLYAVVEAGVLTGDLQNEAKRHGLLYAGDPCSATSCQIAGNVATNAGGVRAIKYGTSRSQIYSIEMVTPEGDIVTVGSRLQKCTTGYALEQLIAGSEGTLGIITKVTVKLRGLPPQRMDLLAIFKDEQKALTLPNRIIRSGADVTSIEFMDNKAVKTSGDYIKVDLPHANDNGCYVIVTIEAFDKEDLYRKTELVDELCVAAGAVEMLIADEGRIWNARRNFEEAARTAVRMHYTEDFVVPLDKIVEIIKILPELEKKHGLPTMTAAHIGDGNIHTILMKSDDIPDEEWNTRVAAFHDDLFPHIYAMGGRLSGEHGIGCKRIKDFKKYTNPAERELMIKIKKALDPKGVLNPGKLFDLTNEN
jgi:glycolate oxidase